MKNAIIVLALLAPATVWAQGPASEDTQVPGGALMLVSYLALWALMLGYLAYLARRQSIIEDDLETLQRRLDDSLGVDD
ncbi:MAG: hypothetical protein R3E66_04210 [bacterium]